MDGIERLRGQLCEASQLRLVFLGKVLIIVLIRELQQAIVAPILTEQRHSQPAAHRGMLAGLCSKAMPVGVPLQFSLGQPNRLILLHHIDMDTKAHSGCPIVVPGGIAWRERKVLAHTCPVALDNQSSCGLMCTNQPPRQVSGQMEHSIDGLGKRIRGRIRSWCPILVKKLGDNHTCMTSMQSGVRRLRFVLIRHGLFLLRYSPVAGRLFSPSMAGGLLDGSLWNPVLLYRLLAL